MSNVTPFIFEGHQVRVITDEKNEPWWVAKDVCAVLGLDRVTDALITLDADEKKEVGGYKAEGGSIISKLRIVNESGLYALIFKGRKAEAKKFRKWVTSEVLPAIRKTGVYTAPQAKPATLLPVDREFRAALRMARAMGLDKNQAVLSADRLAKEITGDSPLSLLQITHLENPEKSQHYTASEIGMMLGGLSGQAANKALESAELQESYRDHKNRKKWRPTDKGAPHVVLKDTGKKSSTGTPVLQMFWKESVLEAVNN